MYEYVCKLSDFAMHAVIINTDWFTGAHADSQLSWFWQIGLLPHPTHHIIIHQQQLNQIDKPSNEQTKKIAFNLSQPVFLR